MWNLSGDDIQRAIEELKGRRAAIQARYEQELKELETELAGLEAFERTAVNIISHLKGGDAAAAPAAAPAPATAEPAAAESASESQDAPVEPGAEAEAGETRRAGERGSSRWRMRLGTAEGGR